MRTTITIAILLLTSLCSRAQFGDLWASFANNGIYTHDFGFNDNLNDVAYDAGSQQIFATGVALSPSFLGELKVLALGLKGVPAAGFAANGIYTYNSPDESYGFAVIPTGDKLLVGGITISLNTGYADMLLLRLNLPDGTLDNTFGTNGVVNLSLTDYDDYLQAMDLQPDGKIVVSGTMGVIDGFDLKNTPVVLRLNADGTLDTDFGTNGMVSFATDAIDNELTSCKVIRYGANAGKIVVAGHWQNTFTGATDFDMLAIRLNVDGSPDATFGTNGKVTVSINGGIDDCFGMDLDYSGNIYLGGFTTVPTTFDLDMAVVKLNSSGQLVPGFGNGGIITYHDGAYNVANDLKIDTYWGNILLCGASGGGFLNPTSMAIWSFNTYNGQPTVDFGDNGIWKHSPIAEGVYELNALELFEYQTSIMSASVGKAFEGPNNDLIIALNHINYTESVAEGPSISLVIYPNPANQIIQVKTSDGRAMAYPTYKVVNSMGTLCRTGKLGDGQSAIDVSLLSSGLYTLELGDGREHYRATFVVE